METKSWCVEWLGSQGDFLAEGKRQPIPLSRLSGLENLYGIGSLEQCPGEVSIFDSVPFVSEVWNPTEIIDSNRIYQAEFLVYTIVERGTEPWFGNQSTARKSWKRRYCREP